MNTEQTLAEQINELKSLVKRINDKLGFEGIGFRLAGDSNYQTLSRSIRILKAVAEGIES